MFTGLQIADFPGLTIETASRQLHRLKAAGIMLCQVCAKRLFAATLL